MVKKDTKSSEELKEELRKEEVKERMVDHAFELFSKGVDDAVVVRDLSVFTPNITVEDVQRLRSQWEAKHSVDAEIEAEDLPVKPQPPVEPFQHQPPDAPEDVEKDEVKKEETPVAEEIARGPMPSVHDAVETERSRAEIVRATEELRRAITSEIRAQESYEHARLEMEDAKKELSIVRAELDEFKHDVDLLKLKKQVAERMPIEKPVLASETARGKHLEEMVSRHPFEEEVGEIIDRKLEAKEAEKEKQLTMAKEKQIKEDLESKEKEVISTIEEYKKCIEELDSIESKKKEVMSTIEEYKKHIEELDSIKEEKPQPAPIQKVKPAEEKPQPLVEEEKPVPVEPLVKPEAKPPRSEPSAGDTFYTKLMTHLNVYKYLIIRKEAGEPVVYHSRLRLIGILIGLGAGIPSGCLLLYVILLLAGVL